MESKISSPRVACSLSPVRGHRGQIGHGAARTSSSTSRQHATTRRTKLLHCSRESRAQPFSPAARASARHARHGHGHPPTTSRRLSSPRPPPTLQAHSPPPMAPPRIARPPLRPPAYRNRTRRRRPDHPHVELPSSVLLRPNRPSEWVALDLLMLTGLPTAALPRQSTAARRAERRLSLLPPSAPLRSPPTPTKPTYR